MKPKDICRTIQVLFETGQSGMIIGPPGTAKSSVAFQAASAKWNGPTYQSTVTHIADEPWMNIIRATDRDPVDLRGLPFVKDGQTFWSRPDLLSNLRPEGGIILIEELPQATPAVQCVLREVLLDHRIGGCPIPKSWTVIATGNRSQDGAGAGKLLTHVASSVVIMNMEVSTDDWLEWALHAGISPDVRAFIGFRPGLLHNFDRARMVNTDPRGWERVSILSQKLPEDLMLPVLSGVVEEGHAAEFIGFRQIYKNLPDVKTILSNPETAHVPTEPAVEFALCGAVVEHCRKADKTQLANVTKYTRRLRKPPAVLIMRDLVALRPEILSIAEAKSWLKDNRDIILGN